MQLQSYMFLTVSVGFQAKREGQPMRDRYEECFSVDGESAESTAEALRELADAVEEGRLYGHIQQLGLEAADDAGEIEHMTIDEIGERYQQELAEAAMSVPGVISKQ